MFSDKNKKGFTLIELLITFGIITILASVVLYSNAEHRARTRDARRVSDLGAIKDAVELYFLNYGSFPAGTIDLDVDTVDRESNGSVLDPQGVPYSYRNISSNNNKEYCLGAKMEIMAQDVSDQPCSTGVATDNYTILGP